MLTHTRVLLLLALVIVASGCREQECKRAAEMKCAEEWTEAQERRRLHNKEHPDDQIQWLGPKRERFVESCVARAHYDCIAGGKQ